jgi:hypothetical protein
VSESNLSSIKNHLRQVNEETKVGSIISVALLPNVL